MENNFSKHLTIVLKKMCETVGAEYESIDFSRSNWFTLYSWTLKQEKDFQDWFVDYLYNNREARLELTGYRFRRKKKDLLDRTVRWFILSHGWKYKKENTEV